MAPSHYLNQCWNIVNFSLRNKFQWNFNRNSSIFIQENAFENVVCQMASILSRPQWVKHWFRKWLIWTNAGILLIWLIGTNFNEMLTKIHTFSFKKMDLKMSSGKLRPLCLGLNVLLSLNPYTLGNAWVRSQHCGYWCPGAKAPGHQYPQCWLNIHCIGPVSYKKYCT